MNYKEQYDFWVSDDYFDEATKAELLDIKNDEKEIEDRFYRNLEYGTGGLRGVIGAGTNRMNIYTVRKASQGLANYILKQDGADKGVVIAYDSRHFSREFAEETALCMAANGIKAYVFESLRPTPVLSFAVPRLGCIAGINITASHNPPEYNGYKVYWEDGAQITAPRDKEIIGEVNAITDFVSVKTVDKKQAIEAGLFMTVGEEIDGAYMEALKKQRIHPEVIQAAGRDLKIVYSPFNGTGNVPVCRILKELGFEQVYVVKEQQLPDPDFTTLGYPNPEEPKSFSLALELAKEVDADIVLATDPDADRLGIYAKDNKTGQYIPFTGNMSGILIGEYILRERTANGTLPENPALVSTIVTTNMAKAVAAKYGVHFVEVLTGFKYIGEQITRFEQSGTYQFVFGMEESYGCLAGTHCRDKDGVVAAMCLCEVAAWCKVQGISLWDRMLELYEEYGYYKEDQYTVTLKGIDGSRKIAEIMDRLRNNPPERIANLEVLTIRDYKAGKVICGGSHRKQESGLRNFEATLEKNAETESGMIKLPKSNVLYFELAGDAWCCVRPSGTEPKIKFYMGVKGASLEEAGIQLEGLMEAVKALALC